MCRLLAGISYFTPLDHPDHQHLTEIIDSKKSLVEEQIYTFFITFLFLYSFSTNEPLASKL